MQKLGKEEGAQVLIPVDDMTRIQKEPKLNIQDQNQKMKFFEDKKRQKIQFMREIQDQREIEGCTFTPQLISKKQNSQNF